MAMAAVGYEARRDFLRHLAVIKEVIFIYSAVLIWKAWAGAVYGTLAEKPNFLIVDAIIILRLEEAAIRGHKMSPHEKVRIF